MLDRPVRADRDEHVLGDAWAFEGAPSDLDHWEGVLHVRVEHVGGLAGQHIVDLDGAIFASSGDVLVFGVILDREGLGRAVAKGVLGDDLDLGVLCLIDSE